MLRFQRFSDVEFSDCKLWQWRTSGVAHSLQLKCSHPGTLLSLAEDPACHFPIGTIFPPDINTSERRDLLDVVTDLVDGETPIWPHTCNPTGVLTFRQPGRKRSADQITSTALLPGISVNPEAPVSVGRTYRVEAHSAVMLLRPRNDW